MKLKPVDQLTPDDIRKMHAFLAGVAQTRDVAFTEYEREQKEFAEEDPDDPLASLDAVINIDGADAIDALVHIVTNAREICREIGA